jgi:CBS-domain-containing membrane protein
MEGRVACTGGELGLGMQAAVHGRSVAQSRKIQIGPSIAQSGLAFVYIPVLCIVIILQLFPYRTRWIMH